MREPEDALSEVAINSPGPTFMIRASRVGEKRGSNSCFSGRSHTPQLQIVSFLFCGKFCWTVMRLSVHEIANTK